ncbi:unnamed protein product [Diamesa serratosioi]
MLNNYKIVAYHDDAKRMDVDLCMERFDIHTSTIIRTEESRTMGAKFLDDVDNIASNERCLKLCCETNECDVFIFEEKGPGTCFLFHCGLPDDFRCKFTSHGNYTSGVLTIPRRDLEYEQSLTPASTSKAVPTVGKLPKLSQNELELDNLKRPSNAYHLVQESTTTSTIPPLGVRLSDVQTTVATTTKPKSLCGRFQFQCLESKECIAIYNACDGIPQCADGSDESKTECPSSPTATIKSIMNGIENQPIVKVDQATNRMNNFPNLKQFHEQNQQPSYITSNQVARPHNREDPQTAPKYPLSHVTQYMDTDTDSHIFNHKGGLLNGNSFSSQYQTKFQHDPYMMPQQPPQQMDESMYREQPQIVRNDWPQQAPQQKTSITKETNSIWPEKLPKENQKASEHKKVSKEYSEEEEYTEDDTQADNDDVTTETPKKKQRKHKKVKIHKEKSKHHEKPLNEQLKQLKKTTHNDDEFRVIGHDGHTEKQSGAILSLTLGCLVLAALSILIGCRFRRVNVRRRRHGKTMVDADFLVNGMYL